jgi:tetratricopeptide (TPR) repeat protein
MRARARITFFFSALLLASMAGSVLLLRQLDRMRTGATLEELLYITSPKILKRMSLGYDGLLADVYWTRAVQYYGGKHRSQAGRYDLLAPLLEVTTALDPQLLIAYEYGSNFLSAKPPEGAGMPERAVELVKHGIRNNPKEWRLYYDLGFINYMELKDYAAAADAFARGSEVPNAHPFLKVMAARMAQHAGDVQMARMLWSTTYQSAQDPSVRVNAEVHLRALQVDEEVSALEALAAQYQQKTGHFPESFSEMQAVGMLRGVPVDPLGHPYKLLPHGRVEVRNPENLPFIKKGIPPGYLSSKQAKFLPSD